MLGELYALYVLESYQGRGLGRELLRRSARALAKHGKTSMLVWVLAANPARAFYEALGAEPVGEKTVVLGGEPLLELAYKW